MSMTDSTLSEGESSESNEWEETLMMLKLPNKVSLKNKKEDDSYCQILGITSEEPVVKVKNQLFAGHVAQTPGSHIFMEIEGPPGSAQAKKNQIKEIRISEKTMELQPVYISSKDGTDPLPQEHTSKNQ